MGGAGVSTSFFSPSVVAAGLSSAAAASSYQIKTYENSDLDFLLI